MTRPATADQLADHNYDLLKHEPRPTDLINAVEIAVLVKGMKNITEAAALIDQYAATVASGAKLEGVNEAYERVFKTLDQHLKPRDLADHLVEHGVF